MTFKRSGCTSLLIALISWSALCGALVVSNGDEGEPSQLPGQSPTRLCLVSWRLRFQEVRLGKHVTVTKFRLTSDGVVAAGQLSIKLLRQVLYKEPAERIQVLGRISDAEGSLVRTFFSPAHIRAASQVDKVTFLFAVPNAPQQ